MKISVLRVLKYYTAHRMLIPSIGCPSSISPFYYSFRQRTRVHWGSFRPRFYSKVRNQSLDTKNGRLG